LWVAAIQANAGGTIMPKPGKKAPSRRKISALPTKALDARQAKRVRGGGRKHIGQPKYEDISIDCGTGMSKTTQ
jgi:hypothetical protein